LHAENSRLKRLIGERDRIRPQWPARADLVDPDAPFAPTTTTQPAAADVPATQPAANPNSGLRPSPPDLYSQPVQKH
jgi:hypothetical protein